MSKTEIRALLTFFALTFGWTWGLWAIVTFRGLGLTGLGAVLLLKPQPASQRKPALAGLALIFFAFIMPLGREIPPIGAFYYRYSSPGWGLLIGYLMILWSGLLNVASARYGGESSAPHDAAGPASGG